jgi:two-component system sensor histidine kinase KdpD
MRGQRLAGWPVAEAASTAEEYLGAVSRLYATHAVVAASISTALVAVVTGVIALFDGFVPVLSLGVLYIFAVLPVAVVWGLRFAVPVSVACMLAFNFFFLAPIHTFTLADGENWFALAVYLTTAVVVSQLAAGARRRAITAEQRERESALLADLAAELLAGRRLEDEVGEIADRAARVLGVESATIELGLARRSDSSTAPFGLEVSGQQVGTIYMPADADPDVDVRRRFLPALAALLAVASERERLASDALEAEMLRRSDLVKTTLLRAVSHDLRSPLTGIRTAIGALRSSTLDLSAADREELMETIEVDSGRLDRLVGDLLDLSRLEAGAASPETEAWDLADVVRQTVETLEGHERVEVAGETPIVEVDASQLQRALANMIENALKFSPPTARVHVQITATRKEAIVRVVDQGTGLEPGELERVFDPFHRRVGDPRAGAGLGLAIARGFVEANGGRVWAESRPGQGATFAIALPTVAVPVGIGA